MPRYVYLFVRTDISPEQQTIQVAHAALEAGTFLAAKPEIPDHIIVLRVRDAAELNQIAVCMQIEHLRFRLISEPDLGGICTALAVEPVGADKRPLFQSHRLWHAPIKFPAEVI